MNEEIEIDYLTGRELPWCEARRRLTPRRSIMAISFETECTGHLSLLFQNYILVVHFCKVENYNWITLYSEVDDIVLLFVFPQYFREYQCVLEGICSIQVDR